MCGYSWTTAPNVTSAQHAVIKRILTACVHQLDEFLADVVVDRVNVIGARDVIPLEVVEPRHSDAVLSGAARFR
jgi:hypothetical protein